MKKTPSYEELEQRVQELESSESENKKLIEALSKSEDRYRNLFKNMLHEVHIWKLVFDVSNNIKAWQLVDANPAALKSWGKTLSEIIGKTTDEIFPGSNATELFMPVVKKIFKEGSPHIWEMYFSGTDQFLHMVSIPFGKYFISTGLDITARKKEEKRLKRSEAIYRFLFENSMDAIFITQDAFIKIANPSASRMTGYSEQELITIPFIELIHPADREMLLQSYHERILNTGQVSRHSHRVINKKGKQLWFESHAIGIIWNDKPASLNIVRDITHQKKTEKALKESEKKFRTSFEASAVGMAIIDNQGNFISVNNAAANNLGYSKDELLEKTFQDIIHPNDLEESLKEFTKYVNKKKSYTIEKRYIKKNKETMWGQTTVSPVFDEDGNLLYAIAHTQDITDRKHSENALFESERKWRNILVNTPQIGISLDTKGRIVFANKHFLKLTGWKTTDIIGQDWFDIFIPEKIKEEIRHVFLSTINQKETSEFSNYENEIVTKSGALKNVAWSNLVTKDLKGEVVEVTCLGIDLTERKNYEMLLEKKNTDLKLAQRIASIGVWTLDPEVGIPEWSEEIYRIYERDPNLGPYPLAEYRNLYKGKYWERFHSAIQGAIADGIPYDIELNLEFPSGKEKWIHAICEPEPEIGPKGHKVRGTIQDITEIKKAEEKLRQSQKMESIGTLAGGIAHEFNNMLGIIIGNTELALDDIPEWNPAADSIQEIRTASLRAKDVVRKLLSVARKTPENRKPIQISPIIKESLSLIRKTIPTTIDIRQNISCSTEMILGDATEINQIVMNLCTNSAHAISEQTGVLEVKMEAVQLDRKSATNYENLNPGDYAKLTVTDSGYGIRPELIERVFDPYFTTKDVDKGLGMGLAVVHGIVKKHEGAIKVKSKVGKGTTVEVFFPLIEEQEVISTQEIETPATGAERILFVDDEASLVKMVTQMLTRSGYEMIGKTNSQEALKLFKEDPGGFDLVITDMAMPKMAGDKFAKQIIQVRPDIPIVLCTGHSDHMDENKAKKLGITAFVMKPLGKADLTKTVRKVLDEAKS